MQIETSNVVKLQITDVPKHDPIHVYLNDYGDGQGRITISEYGRSWTAFWGAMDGSLSDFIIRVNNHYLIGYLAPEFGHRSVKYKQMDSRLNAVKEALRRLHVHPVESQHKSNQKS